MLVSKRLTVEIVSVSSKSNWWTPLWANKHRSWILTSFSQKVLQHEFQESHVTSSTSGGRIIIIQSVCDAIRRSTTAVACSILSFWLFDPEWRTLGKPRRLSPLGLLPEGHFLETHGSSSSTIVMRAARDKLTPKEQSTCRWALLAQESCTQRWVCELGVKSPILKNNILTLILMGLKNGPNLKSKQKGWIVETMNVEFHGCISNWGSGWC